MDDLDDAIKVIETYEARDKPAPSQQQPTTGKIAIGEVEDFFDKISVVAIKLTGDLRVGDLIEIGDEDDAVRQRVSSMQIDRVDVDDAHDGDSVGIKLNYRVGRGRLVYKMQI